MVQPSLLVASTQTTSLGPPIESRRRAFVSYTLKKLSASQRSTPKKILLTISKSPVDEWGPVKSPRDEPVRLDLLFAPYSPVHYLLFSLRKPDHIRWRVSTLPVYSGAPGLESWRATSAHQSHVQLHHLSRPFSTDTGKEGRTPEASCRWSRPVRGRSPPRSPTPFGTYPMQWST